MSDDVLAISCSRLNSFSFDFLLIFVSVVADLVSFYLFLPFSLSLSRLRVQPQRIAGNAAYHGFILGGWAFEKI